MSPYAAIVGNSSRSLRDKVLSQTTDVHVFFGWLFLKKDRLHEKLRPFMEDTDLQQGCWGFG